MKKFLPILLSITIVLAFSLTGFTSIFAENAGIIKTEKMALSTPVSTEGPTPTPKYSGDYGYKIVNYSLQITDYIGSGGNITIPGTIDGQTVTSIGWNAFSGNLNLTSVYIPSSITEIDLYAFSSCFNLTQFIVDSNNESFSSQDGVIFKKEISKLFMVPKGKTGTYTIPDNILTLGDQSFRDCKKLTSIIIPDSVINMGANTFSNCIELLSVHLPDNISNINGCFYYCSALTEITIPNSVTSIGESSFCNCKELTSVIIPANVNYIGFSAFENCTKLTAAHFKGNAPDIFNTSFSDCASGFKVYYLTGKTGFTNPWNGYVTVEENQIPTPSPNPSPTVTPTTTPTPVFGVKLNKTNLTLIKGETYKLIAAINPSNAANKKVTWRTGSYRIATVSSKGIVKANRKGSVNIYVYTVDGRKMAKCRVTVK